MPSINTNRELVLNNPQRQVAKRYYDDERPFSGCISDTKYGTVLHDNTAFYHPESGTRLLFSTQWLLGYPAQVRHALTSNGFKLSPPDAEDCGYQFQQNIGNTANAHYDGSLWIFKDPAVPFNSTVVDHAANVLLGTNPAVPRDLAATSPLIIAGGLVVIVAVLTGLCALPQCLRATKRKTRDCFAGATAATLGVFSGRRTITVPELGVRQPRPYAQSGGPRSTPMGRRPQPTHGQAPRQESFSMENIDLADPPPTYHPNASQDTFRSPV